MRTLKAWTGGLLFVAAATLCGGCARSSTHSKSAVEQAVREHLSQNTHLLSSNFTTSVESVKFSGENADAVVRFQSKENPSLFVKVGYHLKLENGHWEVASSTPMSGQGGDSHGAVLDNPSPPTGGTQPTAPPLQPSH